MKTSLILVTIIGLCWCSACRTVYTPNAANNPFLQEPGELKALIANNNLQAAYALSSHVGVMANGFYNDFTSEDEDFHNSGQAIEVGIGYFGKIPSGKNHLIYEVWGGGGILKVSMDEAASTKSFNTRATRFFLQPGFGWINRYAEVGLSSRFSMINYNNPEIIGYTPQEQKNYLFESLATKPHIFWEPALTVRGGYKWIKLQVQYGKAFKLTTNELDFQDDFSSIGLIFNVGKWYKD